jgi:hypothetical protein
MRQDKYEILHQSGSTYNIPIILEATLDELGGMISFDGDIEQVEQLCNFTYTSSGNVLTVYNTTNTNVLKRVVDATFTIKWGDSTSSSISILGSVSHTYSTSGPKTVTITMNSPWGVQNIVKTIALPSVVGSTNDLGTLIFNLPYTNIEDFSQNFNNDYEYNTDQYTGTTTFFAIGSSRIIEKKLGTSFVYYVDLYKYIPSFTYGHCVALSKKYNFYITNNLTRMYWFDVNDRVNRLKCLEALLTELKTEK